MKTLKKKIITITSLLSATIIAGCNAGKTNSYSSNNTGHRLSQGASLIDAGLLGDKATVVTSGNSIPELNSSSCLDYNNMTYTLDSPVVNKTIIMRTSQSNAFNSLMVSASVSGTYGLLKASASSEYLKEDSVSDTSISVSIIASKAGNLTIRPKGAIDNPDQKKEMLLSPYKEYAESGDTTRLKNLCNTGYVNSIQTGIAVIGNMKINFDSKEAKQKVAAKLAVSYASIAEVAAAVENISKSQKSNFTINLSVQAKGGGSTPSIDISKCNPSAGSNWAYQCQGELNNAIDKLMTNNSGIYDKAAQNVANATSKDSIVKAIAPLYGTGVVSVVKFDTAIMPSSIGFTKEQESQQKLVLSYYRKLGVLSRLLEIASDMGERSDSQITTDTNTLNDISSELQAHLPTLTASCFGWGVDECKEDLETGILHTQFAGIDSLMKSYSTISSSDSYYSKDNNNNNPIYFLTKSSGNTKTLYPVILNTAYSGVSNTNYFSGNNVFDQESFYNPININRIVIENGNMKVIRDNNNIVASASCNSDGKNGYICSIDKSSPIEKNLFGTIIYTNDDIIGAYNKIGNMPLQTTTDHTTDLGSTLNSSDDNRYKQSWCNYINNDAGYNRRCLQLNTKGFLINGTDYKITFTSSQAISQLKITKSNSNSVGRFSVELNGRKLATILNAFENVVFRLDADGNLVAIPISQLMKFKTQALSTNKDDYNSAVTNGMRSTSDVANKVIHYTLDYAMLEKTVNDPNYRDNSTANLGIVYGDYPDSDLDDIERATLPQIPKNCSATISKTSDLPPATIPGGKLYHLVCNGKAIDKVLYPHGVYSFDGTNIIFENAIAWESDVNINPAIAKSASPYSNIYITRDQNRGISEVQFCDSNGCDANGTKKPDALNLLLSQAGRDGIRFSKIEQYAAYGYGSFYIGYQLNNTTKLPIPLEFTVNKTNPPIAIYAWQTHSASVGHIIATLAPYQYYDTKYKDSYAGWYNLYYDYESSHKSQYFGVWHSNDGSIRINTVQS